VPAHRPLLEPAGDLRRLSPSAFANERDNARLVEQTHFRYAVKTAPGAVCKAGADRLCLLKKRFQVEVLWNNQFNGTSGNGRAVPRTDAAGFFSFGDPSNLELMVKLLDFGDTVKVFWGQLTNLKYQLVITDTKTGEVEDLPEHAGRLRRHRSGSVPGRLGPGCGDARPRDPCARPRSRLPHERARSSVWTTGSP
jgi:hypothetical protein